LHKQSGGFTLKALWIILVFLFVSITVTVAALTALFMFWSYSSSQPGTATALAMLFLVAPGVGIASGVMMAIRAASPERSAMPKGVLGLLAAVTGGLAGFGGTMAAMDLIYVDRWSNPASAPAWLPWAPYVAAPVLAIVLALLVLLPGNRTAAGRVPD
jgi:hypothetical protein